MKTNPANRTLELLGLKEFGLREKLFLDLYEPVEKQWRQILKENDETDFETMMRHAAELIESGKWQSPYQLIMVDEFQDTSQLRARILKALLKTQKQGYSRLEMTGSPLTLRGFRHFNYERVL